MQERKRRPYEVTVIDERTWSIEDNGVRALLAEGSERALLVDTGFGGEESLKAVTDRLTERPVIVVNTHADPDHIGRNEEFGTVLMHPAEYASYHARKPGLPVAPIWEGDVIDLGGRAFEVIHIPGHTPGSVALLERAERILLGGDSVSCVPIFMFGEGRSLSAHRESMRRLLSMQDSFDVIWAAHGPMEVEKTRSYGSSKRRTGSSRGSLKGRNRKFPFRRSCFPGMERRFYTAGKRGEIPRC